MKFKKRKWYLIILIIFLPCISCANNIPWVVNYNLTPVLGIESPYLQVEVKFQGNSTGLTPITFPAPRGKLDYTYQIRNINLKNGAEVINSSIPYLKLVKHEPNKEIILTYEVHQQNENLNNIHAVIIMENIIHFPGYGVFALPSTIIPDKGLPVLQDFIITIEWKNMPTNWLASSSFGVDNVFKVIGNTNKILEALYVAGDIRITELNDNGRKSYLSLMGTFNFGDEQIKETLASIITQQRIFFNDYDFLNYYVSIIESDNLYTMSGAGFYTAFAAYLPRNITFENYIILFSHEHFHNWLGYKIRNSEPDSRYYWWSEGFTEYYARVLALRSGALSVDAFIRECNRMLENYYLSPVSSETNKRIEKDFWNNHDIQMLPYYRGFMFALYLNDLIKKDSRGRNSLDNVLFDIFQYTQKQNEQFNHTIFINSTNSYTEQDIKKDIDKYINQGEIIYLNGLAEHLPIMQTEIKKINLGFSAEIALSKEVVKSINQNSNAYLAGIREGNSIKKLKIIKRNNQKYVESIINGRKVTFQLEPDKKFFIWQFKTKLTERERELIKKWFGA